MYNELKSTARLTSNPWVSYPNPNPDAKLRLFCFPYAGGSGHVFSSWKDKLPCDVELGLIQLPGRGARIAEQPFTDIYQLVEELAIGLLPELNKPFAFFGHSMGAVLGFELARFLRRKQVTAPRVLFAAGRSAPQMVNARLPMYNLPKAQFIEKIRELNGTDAGVLNSPELMDLLLPALRADFQMCETYCYRKQLPLEFPISVFGGADDGNVEQDALLAWREQTTKNFEYHWLPGDHFFLHSSRAQLLQILAKKTLQLIDELAPKPALAPSMCFEDWDGYVAS